MIRRESCVVVCVPVCVCVCVLVRVGRSVNCVMCFCLSWYFLPPCVGEVRLCVLMITTPKTQIYKQ